MDWKIEYDKLKIENEKLIFENYSLKKKLEKYTGNTNTNQGEMPILEKNIEVATVFSLQEKIDLFRLLFCGRQDVYAKRWYSAKLKKGGYSPVCENEWDPNLCDKKKYKCNQCPNRQLLPLSDKAVYDHLNKHCKDVIGVYPMLKDETCNFLAMDFDDDDWQKDVICVKNVCVEYDVEAYVERSRSGNGAHLWLFFEEPISCELARKLGTGLLTKAMEKNHQIKFASYDRLFPNQNIMPSGGFGNLIALPLQGEARKMGNSLFVDDEFMPFSDQWHFLSEVTRYGLSHIEKKVSVLCKYDELGELNSNNEEEKPWKKKVYTDILTSFDVGNLQIVRANMLYIKKNGVSQRALNKIKRLAAFKNPEFYKAQAMRFPVYDKPRIIYTAEESTDYLAIPRGCEEKLLDLIGDSEYALIDETYKGNLVRVSFKGELKEEQQLAVNELLKHK